MHCFTYPLSEAGGRSIYLGRAEPGGKIQLLFEGGGEMSRADQVNKTVLRQRGDQTPNRATCMFLY